MRIFFDTEFLDTGSAIELISIGLVREDGRTYYAETPQAAGLCRGSEWLMENVLPHLTGPVKPREQIAAEILEFVGEKPEFWAYFASYDWVALCQLYGTMMGLPKGWPMWCRDLRQLREIYGDPPLPMNNGEEHNALDDALTVKRGWEHLTRMRQNVEASGRISTTVAT